MPIDQSKILEARSAGYSDDEIASYLGENFGLKDQIQSALGEGYSATEVVDYFAPPKQSQPQEETGDTARGFKRAFAQLPELAYGAGALVGMSAENLFGEGGISTATKDFFVEKYQQKQAENIQYAPTVEFDTAWNNLQQGDTDAMADWLQDSAGYVVGQGLQTVATGGVGAVAGKAALTKMLGGMVAKNSEKIVAQSAGKISLEEATKIAAKDMAGSIGAGVALTAQNVGMEAGDIYGGLVEESKKTGKEITGDDLLRAWGAAAAAAGAETATDLLGLGALTGKVKIPGAKGRVARGAVAGGIGMPIEGAQEYVQTGIEQYGAGKPLDTEEAARERWNAAAVGALGGGLMGGAAGVMAPAKQPTKTPTPEDILAAPTIDEAINNFNASLEDTALSAEDLIEPIQPTIQEAPDVIQQAPANIQPDLRGQVPAGVEVPAPTEAIQGIEPELGRPAVMGDGLAAGEAEQRGLPEGATARPAIGAGGETLTRETQDAIQVGRTAEEIPRTGAARADLVEGGQGIRQGQQGEEIAGEGKAQEVESYQWKRNKEGGQEFGNQQQIVPLNENLYNERVRNKVEGNPDFESYRAQYPEASHVSLVSQDRGKTWNVGGVGKAEELRPEKPQLAKRVESFASAEAVKQSLTADTDVKRPEPISAISGAQPYEAIKKTEQPTAAVSAITAPPEVEISTNAQGRITVKNVPREQLIATRDKLGIKGAIIGKDNAIFPKGTDIAVLKNEFAPKPVEAAKIEAVAKPENEATYSTFQNGKHIRVAAKGVAARTFGAKFEKQAKEYYEGLSAASDPKAFAEEWSQKVKAESAIQPDTESKIEVSSKADEIMRLFDDMGGGIAITRDQVVALIEEKGIESAEKTVRAMKDSLAQKEKTAAYRDKSKKLEGLTDEKLKEKAKSSLEEFNRSGGKDKAAREDSAAAVEELARRKKAEYDAGIAQAIEADKKKREVMKAQAQGKITSDQGAALKELADAGEHAAVDEVLKPAQSEKAGNIAAMPKFNNASGDFNPDLDQRWIKQGKKEINGDGMSDAEYNTAVAEYANQWRVDSLLEKLGFHRRGSSNISSSTYYEKKVGVGEYDEEYQGYDESDTYEVRVSDHDDYHPSLEDDVKQRIQLNFRNESASWAEVDVTPDMSTADAMDAIKSVLPKETLPSESIAPNSNGAAKPPQQAQAEQPAEAKPQGKIEDFGEKIAGARKEYAAAYKDRMAEAKTMDVLAQPLSKSWPEPDYQKLVDSGYDKNIVGLVRSMRDEIPSKPGKSYRQATWAKQVELLRDTADKLLNDKEFADKFVGDMKKVEHLKLDDAINGRAELYALLGHEKSLKGIRISRSQYGVYNGVPYNPPKIIWEVTKDAKATAFGNMPKALGSGDTRQAAIDSFAKSYSALDTNKEKDNKTKFELYANRYAKAGDKGQYFIGKKVGRNVLHIKDGFDTVKEARAYMVEHNDELTSILEKKKEIPSERYDTNKPRVGQDMRNGQDVTPQMFADAFGFRGVQFGTYVEGSRRQQDLNDSYDALMDLAAVLDIAPKALSLNGELGLAFGARGTGGKHPASAHYEPGQVVINLTKGTGAGSLAHEWWHSLDSYFSRMAGKKEGFATDRMDVSLAARNAQYQFKDEGIRKEMIEAFGDVVRAVNRTAIKQRSSSLDARRTKEYWGTGIEMSARSFERYVIAKLHDNGFANDYLANVVSEEYWDAAEALGVGEGGSYPYPTEAELPEIRAGFDKFFQTIETKETEKGVALFAEGESITNPHTISSATEAILNSHTGKIKGAIQAMLDAGKARVITSTQAANILGKDALFAKSEQTETPAFKAWFGDSKVVDENGNPLVVYHGGKGGVTEFNPKLAGTMKTSDWGEGVYFTPSKSQAEYYKEESNKSSDEISNKLWEDMERKAKEFGTSIMMESIDLRNNKITQDQYDELNNLQSKWRRARSNAEKEGIGETYATFLKINNPLYHKYEGITEPYLAEQAKANGNDGIIILHEDDSIDEIVVFNPNQIKSATENIGTFDPKNPDIRYSKEGGALAFYNLEDQVTYFIADNIPQDYSAESWRGLVRHELAIHALKMGRNTEEWNNMLSQFERRRKVDRKVKAAFERVPADTPFEHINEEAFAYYIQYRALPKQEDDGQWHVYAIDNQEIGVFRTREAASEKAKSYNDAFARNDSTIKKFVTWFRNALREIGKRLPAMQKIRFMEWANSLTESDLLFMANEAIAGWKPSEVTEPAEVEEGAAALFSTEVQQIWKELASHNELFKFPRTSSKGLEDNVLSAMNKTTDDGKKPEHITTINETITSDEDAEKYGVIKTWEVISGFNKKPAFIYQAEDGRVWLNVSTFKSGKSGGAALYTGVLDYCAKNKGLKLVGDPNGVTDIAMIRRTELMMSASIRHGGRTDFMEPATEQQYPELFKGKLGHNDYFLEEFTPVKWGNNDEENLDSLINSAQANIALFVPEIKNVQYNATTRELEIALSDEDRKRLRTQDERISFESELGTAWLAGAVDRGIKRAERLGINPDMAEGSPYSAASIARAGFAQYIRSEADKGRGAREILSEGLGGLPAGLRGRFYSKGFEASANPASWNAPEASMFDDVVYKLQDKNIDLKRMIQSIRESGADLPEKYDTYRQEELFHGRSAKRVQNFVNMELKPLLTEMQARGLKLDEVDKYLHARHAKEANELIASRDPEMPDGGSGMTNKQADDYLADLPEAQKKKLEATAKRVDSIISQTRELYVSYGLISQEQADSWAQMFKHYVPLMREDNDGGMGVGQGFSIKGKEAKHRTGSTASVVDIFANIAMQREKAIVRGEKNRVSVSLAGLAKLNPNPEIWSFGPVTERRYNENTNAIEVKIKGNWKSADNVVVAKVKDSAGGVQEVGIVFNEQNERAVRLSGAIKNLDASQLNSVLATSAFITRWFSSVNTQYNPIFGVTNLIRDVQGAALNLSSTPLAGHQKEVIGNIASAAKGIYLDARAERKGEPATSKWAGLWEELQSEGGMTGYRDLYKTSADRAKAIEHELDPHNWVNSKWGKVFTANGTLKVPLTTAQDIASPIFGWLSDYNQMMEGSTRLSIYKTALDNGLSKQEAASLAKNTTVNFNRKGQVGQQAGALYAFFNAAMQGTARISQTIFDMEKGDIKTIRLSKTGKAIVAGGITLGAMQALTLAFAGMDDDEPPEFVRERNIIIPVSGGKYISIPMPLGFHVLPNIGRISAEFVLNGFKDPAEHVIRLIGIFAEAFNPIGSSGMSLQTVMPTAIDPMMALAENRDWTGKPIYKEDFSSMKPTPGFTRNKDTASIWSKFMAETINYATGGTAYTPGRFSPTADQIDYLIGQVTGGVGREVSKLAQTGEAIATGEELPTHKMPLLGRFYGDLEKQASQGNRFYSNLKEINLIDAELKGRREDGLPTKDFMQENPKYKLIAQAKYSDNIIGKLRKRKRDMVEKDAPRDSIRAIEERITREMLRFNQAVERVE